MTRSSVDGIILMKSGTMLYGQLWLAVRLSEGAETAVLEVLGELSQCTGYVVLLYCDRGPSWRINTPAIRSFSPPNMINNNHPELIQTTSSHFAVAIAMAQAVFGLIKVCFSGRSHHSC